MKKGIIVNLKKFKLLDYVNINRILLLLCLLYIIGIAIGSAVLSKNSFFTSNASTFFKDLILLHKSNGFIIKLLNCFFRYFVFILLYFLAGNSMLGVAIIPFVTAWQGIITGSLLSYLYKMYGISGIAFNAIIFIPPAVIFTICCFFAARQAIDFSLLIARLTLPRSRPASLYHDFKNYCSKFLIYTAISFITAVFEIILNLLFLKFFNF